MKCDATKEEDILSMTSAVKSQFGGADICINNAGLGHYATLLDGSSAMWKEMFEVRHYLYFHAKSRCLQSQRFL